MRMTAVAVTAACLIGLALPKQSSAQSIFSGPGKVRDGDSLIVAGREVRLFGIDAPEWDQICKRNGRDWACGRAAAEQLSSLISSKGVSCVAVDTDQFGRTVSQCAAGDVDLNRTMVALGYAIAYRRYSSAYVSAEESAKVNRRGIWAGTFELPSLYRQDEREGILKKAPRRARRRSYFAPRAFAPTTGCVIKGNRGSHGWIYHLPGMPYYDRTHAEEWFCTEAQAQEKGYRRARAR